MSTATHFRRVTFTDDKRAGLLGQGSILTVTSYAHRTSPVVRGKWLMENVLGAPPPPPPANVPALEGERREAAGRCRSASGWRSTGRIRSARPATCIWIRSALRSRTSTRSGRWRDTRRPARRSMRRVAGGRHEVLDGRPSSAQVLVNRRDEFVVDVAEKLLTYALGRGVEYFDMPAVRSIVRDAATQRLPLVCIRAGHRQEPAVSDDQDRPGGQ